jgi:hypothetical protein
MVKTKIGKDVIGKKAAKTVEALVPDKTLKGMYKGMKIDAKEMKRALNQLAKGKVEIESVDILPDKTIRLMVKGSKKDIHEFAQHVGAEFIAGIAVLGVSVTLIPHIGGAVINLIGR